MGEKEGRLITDTFPGIHLHGLKSCGSISPPTHEEIQGSDYRKFSEFVTKMGSVDSIFC